MGRRLVLVLAAVSFWQCRSSNARDGASDALGVEDHLWFDAAGHGDACDAPAKSCPAFQDEKDFVDQCVAQGFQARTCGCVLRCSGKVEGTAATAPSAMALTQPAAGAESVKSCNADALVWIDATAKIRTPGSSLDRCIDSHVCNGNIGWCAGEERQTTTRMRALAREGCEAEVLGSFCKEGYIDSLSCPEPAVQQLSQIWAELANKDSSVKRCIRGFACNGDRGACAGDALKEAQAVKAALDKDGCEYWLRLYCSIGSKSW